MNEHDDYRGGEGAAVCDLRTAEENDLTTTADSNASTTMPIWYTVIILGISGSYRRHTRTSGWR
jgi:hypothetical protein